MKKILLLLVSGLLIACMAGSAMASPAYMTLYDLNGNEIKKITGGNPTTIRAHVSDIYYTALGEHSRTISVTVKDGPLEVEMSDDGGITWTPKTGETTSLTYTASPSKNYDFLVRVSGYNGLVTVADTSDDPINPNTVVKNYDVASQSPSVDIPEFPTIGVTVASIIGLLFIFGRKKEGL